MLTEKEALARLKTKVPDEHIKSVDDGASFFIPIEQLEDLLDEFSYSTRSFQYQIFKDGYANLCVAASLELIINYKSDNGKADIQRSFVGACNFPLGSLGTNTHFLATAKSECEKNAAQDAGEWLGRGLNVREEVPDYKAVQKEKKTAVKKPADSKIQKQFDAAMSIGDVPTMIMLENIYEIKKEGADATEK